jgi:hypothetical protein
MYKNLLPIGSVVLLEGGEKRVMICGRVQGKVGEERIYDYSACCYPEGILNSDEMLFFDHSAIDTVYFIGFQDTEEFAFRTNVLEQLGELGYSDGGIVRE